jgi:hypothetical protein
VAGMGEKRNALNVLLGTLEGESLKDLDVGWVDDIEIDKLVFKK